MAARLTLIVLLLAGTADAHFTAIPHDLAGVHLGVDEQTFDLWFERGGAAVEGAVRARLERFVPTLLDGTGIPWSHGDPCPSARGYLSVRLHVREAPDLAPRASRYHAAVQVGPRGLLPDGRVAALPPDAFDFEAVDDFDELAVGIPAFVFLPRYLEAALRDLSVAWWEDQPRPATASDHARRGERLVAAAVAATVSAAAATALAAAAVVRRRGRASP